MNEYGQPIGFEVPRWKPCEKPQSQVLQGRTCCLEPFDTPGRFSELASALSLTSESFWTYLPVGPFEKEQSLLDFGKTLAESRDPLHYFVIDSSSDKAVGSISLMRHDPSNGVIEIGWVLFSPLMQRSVRSTEAQFLLLHYVFDKLGYRRCEWKCDSLNGPSRRAATRLGFKFEGNFRQATIYKGRNRDTAWFAILDTEWPGVRQRLEQWLDPKNFDRNGNQKMRLEEF